MRTNLSFRVSTEDLDTLVEYFRRAREVIGPGRADYNELCRALLLARLEQ